MADTRRTTQPVDSIADLPCNNWKECQKIFLDGYAGCSICQQSGLRSRCLACKNLSRRMVGNLRTQAEHSSLSNRVHATLMTMAGKKALTDAFCLNASDKPKWARWPDFNFEAFFANLDQQTAIICSRCQERKLRLHFSRTQLQRPSQSRKCRECTKPPGVNNLSRLRYQQAKPRAHLIHIQVDAPSSKRKRVGSEDKN